MRSRDFIRTPWREQIVRGHANCRWLDARQPLSFSRDEGAGFKSGSDDGPTLAHRLRRWANVGPSSETSLFFMGEYWLYAPRLLLHPCNSSRWWLRGLNLKIPIEPPTFIGRVFKATFYPCGTSTAEWKAASQSVAERNHLNLSFSLSCLSKLAFSDLFEYYAHYRDIY